MKIVVNEKFKDFWHEIADYFVERITTFSSESFKFNNFKLFNKNLWDCFSNLNFVAKCCDLLNIKVWTLSIKTLQISRWSLIFLIFYFLNNNLCFSVLTSLALISEISIFIHCFCKILFDVLFSDWIFFSLHWFLDFCTWISTTISSTISS